MENASKALIIAGSVLISLIVIASLTFMYGQIVDVEQTRTDVEEAGKITDYGKRFEQYNKTIYGSELLSLANLQEDYNKTQAAEKGYNAITIKVTITKSISGTAYFSAGTKDITSITKDKNAVEDTIKQYEDTSEARKKGKLYKNRVVKYYAQISNREIATIFGISYSSSEADYDIGTRLETAGRDVGNLMKDIEAYKSIKTTYTEFKSKRFKCTNVGYDKYNGRLNLMEFREI